MRWRVVWSFLAGAALSLANAAAEAEAAGESNSLQAIRAASREYVEANRRGDLKALGKMWTPDGDYVDATGRKIKAKQLVDDPQKATKPDVDGAASPSPGSSVRLITPDVAIEDGTSLDGEEVIGRYTAVWVKRDGRWLLDSLREVAVDAPPVNKQLQPLAWLLGEWTGTTDDAVILMSSHLSDDGQYIERDFLIRADAREDITAKQRIGWDKSAGKFRSWTFDSLGGTSEGSWRLDGKRWRVDSTEVLADGKKSKTSAVYTPGDDGHFVCEISSIWDTNAKAAGPKLPAVRIEFNRAPEE